VATIPVRRRRILAALLEADVLALETVRECDELLQPVGLSFAQGIKVFEVIGDLAT
jgi:hypothetical protein